MNIFIDKAFYLIMRKETHLIAGSIVGFLTLDILLLFGVNLSNTNMTMRIFLSTLAMLGAAIPDTFEIARNYNHRKFFHSKTMLFLLIFIVYAFIENEFVFAFCGGYISHLLLDSTTRKSLPLY